MKKLSATLILLLVASFACHCVAQLPSDSVLRRYAAQMLMVGFKGDSVTPNSDAARYVRDLHVGAIVLFDIDLTGCATIGSRNITSRERLERLTATLQSWSSRPLLIALDQEGGRVARLKPQYGFEPTVTAEYLGQIDNLDTTRFYTRRMVTDLATSGINLNLAPVLDIHRDDCPAIGHFHRSFGTDSRLIVRHAGCVIDEHHRQHVLCAVKHFPGHGSAVNDSHWGFVDVTSTWQPSELEPFKQLIKRGKVDVVMTAHIFNRNLDADFPATLSRKTIDGVLRKQLGFDGVVVTDDLYMEAIINNYSIERALVLAINAGADLLCVGNNISTGFEADRPFHLVDLIVAAVKRGEIPYGRLIESHRRLDRLAAKCKR